MPGPQKPPIKPNLAYCCSFNLLLLKLFEVICTLASLILALTFEGQPTMVIIEIFSALSLVTAISWILLYCLNLNARFPDFFSKLLLCYHLFMVVINIIATVCAAFLTPNFKDPYYLICTITSLAASVLFTLDTIHNFLVIRGQFDEIVVCCCSPWEAEITI